MIGPAMAHSMTAFAREESDAEWGAAVWELRSVNHRYLDVSLRLPEELRSFEARVRERVATRVRRGKVECSLRIRPSTAVTQGLSLDSGLVERLLLAARKVETAARRTPDGLPLRPSTALEVLRWPGVVEPPGIDREAVEEAVIELLDRTLDSLVEARRREGAKLGEMVSRRCEEVAGIAASVREALPQLRQRYRDRLLARLDEARANADPNRLAHEMVMFANRSDIDEELDRLDAHVTEVREALASRAPIGRRLDFLMQELQREANTLGSKSVDPDTSRASVDLKVLIEQMREQVQNIE